MESLKCPFCASSMSRVLETRMQKVGGHLIKIRVRRCGHCQYQYRTKEVTDDDLPLINRGYPKYKDNGNHKLDEEKDTNLDEMEAQIAAQRKENNPVVFPPVLNDAEQMENKTAAPQKKRGRPKKEKKESDLSGDDIFPPLD